MDPFQGFYEGGFVQAVSLDDLAPGGGGLVDAFGIADQEAEAHIRELGQEFFAYFTKVLEARRKEPSDDLVSVIANARVDGAPMGVVEEHPDHTPADPIFESGSLSFFQMLRRQETISNPTHLELTVP